MQKQCNKLVTMIALIIMSCEVQSLFKITPVVCNVLSQTKLLQKKFRTEWRNHRVKIQNQTIQSATDMSPQEWVNHLEKESFVLGRRNSNKYKRLLDECAEEMKESLGKK